MKAYAIAILFIISGITCFVQPGKFIYGVGCSLIGIVIILSKVYLKNQEQKRLEEYEEQQHEIVVQKRQAAAAREQWEKQDLENRQKISAWSSVLNKWMVIMNEHERLLSEIGVAYTIANNLKLPNSPQMQHVIELCKKDIALAEMSRKAQEEIQQVRIKNGWADASVATIVSFPTFKRLAIIYEKQKDYDSAIAVCQQAIELGYSDDGTDGQMPGRIARLLRKAGNARKKIPAAASADSYSKDSSD